MRAKLAYFISIVLCFSLIACSSNTNPKAADASQANKPAQQPIQNNEGKKVSQQNNPRKLATLNGHKTTHGRVLAAGGYISGAIGGS